MADMERATSAGPSSGAGDAADHSSSPAATLVAPEAAAVDAGTEAATVGAGVEGAPGGRDDGGSCGGGGGVIIGCLRPRVLTPKRQFYTIAVTYVLFTLVDGALRLIVLMQANQVGFSAFQVSLMFVLYELLGVFTNLGAGALGARFGLKNALLLGLVLEIVSVWAKHIHSHADTRTHAALLRAQSACLAQPA